MKDRYFYSFFLIALISLILFFGVSTTDATGLKMATYVAPDQGFSFYYPEGWTVQSGQDRVMILQNPQIPHSAAINLMPLQFGQQFFTSEQIIQSLAQQSMASNPTMAIDSIQKMSYSPDISSTSYSYQDNMVRIVGLGVAISHGTQGFWADIYGKQESFSGFNPAEVLIYVLSSLNSGSKPATPQMIQQEQPQQAGKNEQQMSKEEIQKKTEEAAVGAHMWNMAPYIAPDVFTTMPLW